MSEITVTFVCGHRLVMDRSATLDALACPDCGQRRVRSVSTPPPTIRARDCEATGPLVRQE